MPSWLFNRQKDRETGNDIYLIGPEIDLHVKADLDLMKSMNSWRGYRHSYGLKVRCQKTRTTGRKRKAGGSGKEELLKKGLDCDYRTAFPSLRVKIVFGQNAFKQFSTNR